MGCLHPRDYRVSGSHTNIALFLSAPSPHRPFSQSRSLTGHFVQRLGVLDQHLLRHFRIALSNLFAASPTLVSRSTGFREDDGESSVWLRPLSGPFHLFPVLVAQ